MKTCCTPPRDGPATTQAVPGRAAASPALRSTKGLIHVPAGRFLMGGTGGHPTDGEGPVREVTTSAYLIDPHAVTNARFAAFVKASGYRTEAEGFGWSFVFHLLLAPEVVRRSAGSVSVAPWWIRVENASWRQPEGPGSSIAARQSHPVVHVTWNDAQAYCAWAGRRLPTEAEWERAARAGREQQRYPWGDELTPRGRHRCNIWQGTFPTTNTAADGFVGTAPVGTFPPNDWGLYNMSGNVWEWCADWFSALHPVPERADPIGPSSGAARVLRGGSYLCHDSYCDRYRVSARSSNTPDSSTGNMGFRCAGDASPA